MTLENVKALLSLPGFDPFDSESDKAELLAAFDLSMNQFRHSRLRVEAQAEIDSIDARLGAIRAEQKRMRWHANPLAMHDERRQLHRRRDLLTTSVALATRS